MMLQFSRIFSFILQTKKGRKKKKLHVSRKKKLQLSFEDRMLHVCKAQYLHSNKTVEIQKESTQIVQIYRLDAVTTEQI